jgi:DNA mismatch repair ATPase MutL
MDRKFIVTVVAGRYIVAFDQHAVHERIMLEALQGGLDPRMVEVVPVCMDHIQPQQENLLLPWFRVAGGHLTGCAVVCEEMLTVKDLQEHLADVLSGFHGIPKCVFRLLAFKACRGAIKFGDVVDNVKAKALMEQLRNCDFPFICAHGRTSFAILSQL